ncbi:MAG: DMT family transporter [Lachnospiraceae bacterium]|nr:DMT family transporter [Lachnospiraceae bacterium]
MWGILVAAISGALMSIQGVFNAEVTKQSSIWMSASFVQLTAFVVCVLAWLITGRDGTVGSLLQVTPKYMLLGGVIGAFITYTVIFSMNAVGPARSVMFIVAVQLLVAYLIELFGIFGVDKQPFEWRKCIGVLVIIAGIVTFKWK